MEVERMVRTKQGHLRIAFTHEGRQWGIFLSQEEVVRNWLACQGRKLRARESFGTYVDRRIEEVFNDLAGEAGDRLVEEFRDKPEELPAGALAFELMEKSVKLQEAWRKIVEVKDETASDPV